MGHEARLALEELADCSPLGPQVHFALHNLRAARKFAGANGVVAVQLLWREQIHFGLNDWLPDSPVCTFFRLAEGRVVCCADGDFGGITQ